MVILIFRENRKNKTLFHKVNAIDLIKRKGDKLNKNKENCRSIPGNKEDRPSISNLNKTQDKISFKDMLDNTNVMNSEIIF